MPAEKDDKTEPATDKRREETREKGQVAKSREVTSVAVLVAGIFYFYFFGDYAGQTLMNLARFFFQVSVEEQATGTQVFTLVLLAMRGVGWVILPLLGLVAAFAVLAHIVQFGLLFSAQALVPKFGKLNPLEGVKRLLGKQGWMDLFKSIMKIVVVGFIGYITIAEAWEDLPRLAQMHPAAILAMFSTVAMKIGIRCAAILVFLAAIDYAFQRYSFEQSIKMTKDEVKQEHKQREGDPMVKARVRQVQREMARKRMMSLVPKADVVITNPTHYAIAILYDREQMDAPQVVAKGRGFVAKRIRDLAEEHNVPLVEDKVLARGLYKAVRVGDAVPTEFYKAVAEILAYVYTLKHKAA